METLAKKILLVEDEAIIAIVQKKALEDRGYAVSTCSSGEKAVELFQDSVSCDLVLMDINLGTGIDGTETARQILSIIDIPVVFLSSHTEKDIVEKTESITSYGYVVKNSGITVLDASIKMAFRLYESRVLIDKQNAEIAVNNEYLRQTIEDLQVTNEELDVTNTQHIATAQELLQSERKYKQLFDNTTAGYALHQMVYDAEGKAVDYRFVDLNPAFERQTGLRAADLIGKTVLEAMPDTEPYWIETYAKVAGTGEPMSYVNYSNVLRKHFEVWVFCPEPGFFATVINDITARVQAEDELKDTLAHYKQLFDTSAQGIVYQDAQGKIISANPSAERLLGMNQKQMLGLESVDPRWQALHEDGSPFPGEEHPAMVALRTGREVKNVVIGIYNPILNHHTWTSVTAIPLFRDGE